MKRIKIVKIVYSIVLLLALWGVEIAYGQYYYLLCYGDVGRGNDRAVYLKSINPESVMTQDSILLMESGCIDTYTPIIIQIGQNQYRLFFVVGGYYDKNTSIGAGRLYWWIENGTGNINIIKQDSLIGVTADIIKYGDEPYFRFAVFDNINNRQIYQDGRYTLNDSLRFIRIGSDNTRPGLIDDIGTFRFPRPLSRLNNRNLYYAFGQDASYWALKLNSENTSVVASINLSAVNPASHIFACINEHNRLYSFNLNYEIHEGSSVYNRNYGQNWIDPEVIIYDPQSLLALEHHPIADFTEGNYPGKESGPATVVGDYIVYYFSKSEGIGQFDPAMLFIFDTRTNQATWLRVGWR